MDRADVKVPGTSSLQGLVGAEAIKRSREQGFKLRLQQWHFHCMESGERVGKDKEDRKGDFGKASWLHCSFQEEKKRIFLGEWWS